MKINNWIYITIGLIFTACGGKTEEVQVETIKPVKYGKVIISGGLQLKTFSGTAKSATEANLSFRTNGQLQSLKVKVGDKVKRGQVLGALDNKDAQLSYQQAKASLDNAIVQRNNSKSNLERTKQLYQASNVSLSEYDQAKASYANANSQYENAVKSLDLQQRQLSYFTLIAPTNGIVASVAVEENEVVQAGAPVVTITAGKEIEIEVGIPEAYISKINKDDEVTVSFSSLKNKSFKGRITEVPYSAGTSAVYNVTLAVINPTNDIRPGMSSDITFEFGNSNHEENLIVPTKAVGEGPDGKFVYTLKEADGNYIVEKRPVTIGDITVDGFIVLRGLAEGELVATAGLKSLYNGRKVKLLNK